MRRGAVSRTLCGPRSELRGLQVRINQTGGTLCDQRLDPGPEVISAVSSLTLVLNTSREDFSHEISNLPTGIFSSGVSVRLFLLGRQGLERGSR